MGSIPLAFSVHHFINSVGSDAGFAAIIGLAVLILLYFAHARETANLREQLYEWAQRVQQLEARITQLSRQQASVASQHVQPAAPATQQTPAPAPARAGMAAATVAATGAPVPARALAGAPAGVAAPALTAATRLIPAGEALAPERPEPPEPEEPRIDDTAMVSPAPVTVAGGANGSSHDHVQAQPVAAGATAAPPPPRIQIRPGGPAPSTGRRPPAPPRGQPQRGGGGPSRARRGLLALLAVAVVGVVVAGLLILTSGGGSNKPKTATSSSQSSNASSTRHRTKTAPTAPASTTVAVLNGTATNGLAGRVSQKLQGEGYKLGRVDTAADQTHTATVVAYLSGHRNQALAVAHSLNLGPAAVQAVDASTQAVACPPPAACTAGVVVTVGSDLATTQ
jgi:hypothetical protein